MLSMLGKSRLSLKPLFLTRRIHMPRLENTVSGNIKVANGGPTVQIQIEDTNTQPTEAENILHDESFVGTYGYKDSPLAQFRAWTSLSVTDLVSPAWCEVQYDYGLRGKRSRPISQRPRSFISSSGKTISPEATVVQKNDAVTRQGRAVHKQLERELKFEELKVDITTEETRWALRLVNMLACLQGVVEGFTREMPVFGIIHGEVVVGIMDEVCKLGVPPANDSPKTPSKRPAESASSPVNGKRARTISPSQRRVDSYFSSPKKSVEKAAAIDVDLPTETQTGYLLSIKDHKTRNRPFLPSDADMFPSQLQLMTYRRLLSELVSRDPPYDFARLWDTIGVDPTVVLPTKFLVQARLIKDTSDFPSTSLNDLVDSWRDLLDRSNILGVDTTLELIYHVKPNDIKGKRKARVGHRPMVTSDEDADLARAIALSLESAAVQGGGESSRSTTGEDAAATVSEVVPAQTTDALSETEDAQLQWALQQSVSPANAAKSSEDNSNAKKDVEDDGIRSFKIIGSKCFPHDDQVLDDHLNHVMQWWRGEREPEGVPIDRTYRCNTCEYANDCEWRAQKALEFSKKRSESTRPTATI
ncbi:hypothetical protein CVT26_009297 [Gymnopilus dilepis]|uniref:Exonuclease V, mitochondrial n=1 Tax=Gymnopilus dilepis TaxID=231916 RepID=A0A409YAB6_9AGAR|nr:hypothetical protein CVT26_009297 [Gymnopilus dilepis]